MNHGIWATVRGRVTFRPDKKLVGTRDVCNVVLTVTGKAGDQRVKVAAWGELAELVDVLERGTDVEITGWLRLGCWTGRDGVEHHEMYLTAEELGGGEVGDG